MTFRAFVAVTVPITPALGRLLAALSKVPADLKVVATDQVHVTLSFLGHVNDEDVPAISAALDAATANRKAFDILLEGVGAFPNAKHPRVVWAGTRHGAPLEALADGVRRYLSGARFKGDDKAFRPHATIARVKSEQGAGALIDFIHAHMKDPLGPLPVREVHLYRSDLAPEGPTYTVVHTARLEG